MNLNELRIGNYVQGDTDGVYQWELSDFYDWYNDHNSHEYGRRVHPIPLTAQWLLRLSGEEADDIITVDRFRLRLYIGYNFWYVTDEKCTYITKVEFVHEWQNVYFFLNGITHLKYTNHDLP